MKVAVPLLAPVLRSAVQAKILAELFADPEIEHSVAALTDRAGTSIQTAIREIDRAEVARIVTSRRIGDTRLVRAETTNPLYRPYAEIVLSTYGPPAILRQELAGLEGVEQLYIFGSWAARYEGEPGPAPNDIDVLVVGDPDRQKAYEAAERAERRLKVAVQVTIRSPAGWASEDDPFVAQLHLSPLVSLTEEPET